VRALPDFESVICFVPEENDSPGSYLAPRPWLFGATVVASILERVVGSEAAVFDGSFTPRKEEFLPLLPDYDFSVLDSAAKLDEGDVVLKLDGERALFLPRSRENLEAAAYLAWKDGIHAVSGLTERRTAWCRSGITAHEVIDYVQGHAFCTFYGSYTGSELRIHKTEYTEEIRAALPSALCSWNLR